MGSKARKERKRAGVKFEQEAKTPTTPYRTKAEARKSRRASEKARAAGYAAAFAVASQISQWPIR